MADPNDIAAALTTHLTTEASWQRRGGASVPGPTGGSARVMLAGDTHGNLDWLQTLSKLAARHRCAGIVQLGDFGFWPDQRVLKSRGDLALNDRWLDAVASAVSRFGLWLRVIDGNHDAHPLAAAAYPPDPTSGIAPIRDGVIDWATRGAHWTWCAVRFGALGGAVSIDRAIRTEGVNWWPTEFVTAADVDRLASRGPVEVLLTHDAPAGVDIPGITDLGGLLGARCLESRRSVLRAVEATHPTLLVHGHYHRRYTSALALDVDSVRIEGLASDQQAGDGGTWVVLELPSLHIFDESNLPTSSSRVE